MACASASVPIDYQLYLPKSCCDDPERCERVGVPEDIEFATKPEIALEKICAAHARSVRPGTVLADSVYGNNSVFREGLTRLDIPYMVHVNPTSLVCSPGVKLLPLKPYSGRGRRPKRLRFAKGHEPQSCKQLALDLDESAWQYITWREGTNAPLSSWFAAVRVHVAHEGSIRDQLPDEQWLLVEWPDDESAPTKYWFGTLSESSALHSLVNTAKERWHHVERDYQELKDKIGLNHYEGRNWRGCHLHAALCIASYPFLVGQRLTHPNRHKKTGVRQEFSLPEDFISRGSPKSTTSC